jgi:hypothetical protein
LGNIDAKEMHSFGEKEIDGGGCVLGGVLPSDLNGHFIFKIFSVFFLRRKFSHVFRPYRRGTEARDKGEVFA